MKENQANKGEKPAVIAANEMKVIVESQSKSAQRVENLNKGFLGEAKKLGGERLSKVLWENFKHFEEHRHTTNLVGQLYFGLMHNGAKSMAETVKLVSSYVCGISLSIDKTTGEIKHGKSKKLYKDLSAEAREVYFQRLENGEVRKIQDEIMAGKGAGRNNTKASDGNTAHNKYQTLSIEVGNLLTQALKYSEQGEKDEIIQLVNDKLEEARNEIKEYVDGLKKEKENLAAMVEQHNADSKVA